jgi:uncharacterized membrane protein YjjP (DUF1212 family)
MATNDGGNGLRVELLLRFARSAHETGGYPATELEPRIIELGSALGLEAVQAAATPTAVELTVGSIPEQQVYVLRVHPHPVDLHAIGRLDEIAADLVGAIAGVFAAAFLIGVIGSGIARRFHRSALAFVVPGTLMLVPGTIGYESASSLIAGQTVTGIDRADDALVIMLAIAYGLVASTLVLRDRRTAAGQAQVGDVA